MRIDSEPPPAIPPASFWERMASGRLFSGKEVIPVVRLSGAIGSVSPLRGGLTIVGCATALERAFTMKSAPAVVLQINSPGGSPVQSRLIYERIRLLAGQKKKKVFAFAEDVAASGGYMLACAADEIYADGSSLIGSIGVLSSGFGFVDLIHKLGIERRVYTAGDNKFQLDPFRPEKPDEIKRLKDIQDIVHRDFIALVKESRGPKIAAAGNSLFTGEFWSGRQALELGLIDGIIDMRSKMRSLYGDNVRLKLVSRERGFFRWRPGLGSSLSGTEYGISFAQGFADDLISTLEERALWARFGL